MNNFVSPTCSHTNLTVVSAHKRESASPNAKRGNFFGGTLGVIGSENELFDRAHLPSSHENGMHEIDAFWAEAMYLRSNYNFESGFPDPYKKSSTTNLSAKSFKNPAKIQSIAELFMSEPFQSSQIKPKTTPLLLKKSKSKKIDLSKTTDNENPFKRNCGCKNSKCLRLHCKCFKELGFCGPHCGCVDCFNVPEFSEVRSFVIEKTKQINRNAFKPRVAIPGDAFSGKEINSHGCLCKTGCKNGYCLCNKNGLGCTPMCRCVSCKNEKVELDRDAVKQLSALSKRRKERLVICTDATAPVTPLTEEFDFGFTRTECKSGPLDFVKEKSQKNLQVAFQSYKKVKIETINISL
jgi:hypothetical protein